MSGTHEPAVAVLVTGLFSDDWSVEAALATLTGNQQVVRIALRPDQMNEEDWDGVVRLTLSAQKVVTV